MKRTLLTLLICLLSMQRMVALSTHLFRSEALSSNLPTSVCQDRVGFIWVATEHGLNRFDGYTFHTYTHDEANPSSLADNHIHRLTYDLRQGDVWVCSTRLQRYNPVNDSFDDVLTEQGETLRVADVTLMDSLLLAVTYDGALYRLDAETRTLHPLAQLTKALQMEQVQFLTADADGRTLWVGGQEGLVRLDLRTARATRYGADQLGHTQASGAYLAPDHTLYIYTPVTVLRYLRAEGRFERLPFSKTEEMQSFRCLTGDGVDGFYVGTFGSGVYHYAPATRTFRPITLHLHRTEVGHMNVSTLYFDRDQRLWVGWFQRGVMYVQQSDDPFTTHDIDQFSWNNHSPLSLLAPAPDGNLWVGQVNNGLHQLRPDGSEALRCLPSTTPIAMKQDTHGRLWVGLYDRGAGQLDARTGRYTEIPEFHNRRIRAIDEDADGNLYFAVFNRGVYTLQPDGTVTVTLPDSLNSHETMTLLVDTQQRLWIAGYQGLRGYDLRAHRALQLPAIPGLPGSLVNRIAQAPDHTLWLATSTGLYHFDPSTGQSQRFSKAEGFPCDMICDVSVTAQGEVWMSSYHGLLRYQPATSQMALYSHGAGLETSAYLRMVGCELPSAGRLFFGSDEGFVSFRPQDIGEVDALTPVHISQIDIPLDHAMAQADSVRLSSYTLDTGERLHLRNSENVVALSFLAMDRIRHENLCLQYRIGRGRADKAQWITLREGENTIQLGPLSGGRYDFEVRTTVNGVNSPSRHFLLQVDYPWYLSWWMILINLSILGVIVYLAVVNYLNRRRRLRNEERIRFFINLTHELRTPTTLMLTPLQDLMRHTTDPDVSRTLRAMYRNGSRLLQMLNQILDVRKIDKGKMQMHCSETDIVSYVHDIYHVYEYEAEKRGIRFTFVTDEPEMMLYVDREQFDKVIYNLLTNAFKYVANKEGAIEVALHRLPAAGRQPERVEISVTDNGRGIDPAEVRRIFERFYQAAGAQGEGRAGFGIGLNLTHDIVSLHHGHITAGNRTDGVTGAVFTVTLPMGHAHLRADEILQSPTQYVSVDPVGKVLPQWGDDEARRRASGKRVSGTLLIADDDEEMRRYLQQTLGQDYRIILCADGAEALEKTIRHQPDLVISDISMPKVDGFELLTRLKNNSATTHIPIILLTSLKEHETKIAGLQKGADAYLEKPFDLDELLARVQGLIDTRSRLKGKFAGYQEQVDKVEKVEIQGANDQLMENVMKVINAHFSDAELNVEYLAEQVGMSRTQLHRRIKEVTGLSCGEFIRNFRMQQAARLLTEGDIYVAQIGYAVGYTNPAHFSTAFKKYYGVTPSEYAEREGRV